MGIDADGYYSLREILGYNCKVNFILSDRGRGKSWHIKHFLMNQEGTFMCLYRQKPDLQAAVQSWVDPLLQSGAFTGEQLRFDGSDQDGMVLYLNDEIKGYFRYLTQVNHIKQEVFPDDLNWLWWDEFIPLVYKKLPGVQSEGDALRAIMKTIEHDTVHTRKERGLKPLRVLLVANPFTFDNPILSYFRVPPRYGIRRVGPDIVSEIMEPAERPKGAAKTMDDWLGDEVNRNQGFLKEDAFVVPDRPPGISPYICVRFGSEFFTLYSWAGRYWIDRCESNAQYRWGTIQGMREGEDCILEMHRVDWLKRYVSSGRFLYSSISVKFLFIGSVMQ